MGIGRILARAAGLSVIEEEEEEEGIMVRRREGEEADRQIARLLL